MAVRLIYQTYAGWDAAIYFSEEVQRPDRNIARSTFWGIGLCALVYVLINAAVLHVLSPAQVAGSALAVGDAAKVSLGPAADLIITGFGLFSLAAIVNLQAMVATRVSYRMARDGAMPTVLGQVAQGGTPRWSLMLHIVVAMLFAATGGYESIVRIYAPWTIGSIFMVILSQIRLRYAEPDLVRPWRVPWFPVVSLAAALVQGSLLAVVMLDDPKDALLSVVVVAAPIPIYLLAARRWRAAAANAFG
jgi:APA family basic amino acid/polyamine antiporter